MLKLKRDEKMKTKSGMPALGLLLVVALAGAIFVPVVSAESENNLNENFSSGGDIVGIDTQLKRSPFLFDEEGNRLSDKEISEMIEKMPRVTYLDGMTEAESKKISERLNQLHQYRSISKNTGKNNSLETIQVQADAGASISGYHNKESIGAIIQGIWRFPSTEQSIIILHPIWEKKLVEFIPG